MNRRDVPTDLRDASPIAGAGFHPPLSLPNLRISPAFHFERSTYNGRSIHVQPRTPSTYNPRTGLALFTKAPRKGYVQSTYMPRTIHVQPPIGY